MLCEEAGLAYVRDYGVQQDQGTAAQFFLKACNANNVSACAQIGVIRLCSAVGRDVFKYVAEEMQHVTHGSDVFTAQSVYFYVSGCLCFHDEDVGLVIWINA